MRVAAVVVCLSLVVLLCAAATQDGNPYTALELRPQVGKACRLTYATGDGVNSVEGTLEEVSEFFIVVRTESHDMWFANGHVVNIAQAR